MHHESKPILHTQVEQEGVTLETALAQWTGQGADHL